MQTDQTEFAPLLPRRASEASRSQELLSGADLPYSRVIPRSGWWPSGNQEAPLSTPPAFIRLCATERATIHRARWGGCHTKLPNTTLGRARTPWTQRLARDCEPYPFEACF